MIQFGIERHPLFGWVRLKASARTKTEGIQTPARKILSGRIRAWKQMGKSKADQEIKILLCLGEILLTSKGLQ